MNFCHNMGGPPCAVFYSGKVEQGKVNKSIMPETVAIAEPFLPTSSSRNDSDDRDDSSSCLWSAVWIALLIWIAWPVAFFALGLWIGLQPFEALLDILQIVNRLLEQVVTWPRACGQGTRIVGWNQLCQRFFFLRLTDHSPLNISSTL